MGGPTVDTSVESQEQQNQKQGEQYAAQQQQAALAGLAAYLKANPSPISQAGALQAPNTSSPATIGGGQVMQSGRVVGGTPTQRPPQAASAPTAPTSAAAPTAPAAPSAPSGGSGLTAQQAAALLAQLNSQRGTVGPITRAAGGGLA